MGKLRGHRLIYQGIAFVRIVCARNFIMKCVWNLSGGIKVLIPFDERVYSVSVNTEECFR